MKLTDWIGRAFCLAITFGTAALQVRLYTPENNLWSAAFQSVLSALTNTIALLAAWFFVRGRVGFELQRLAFCAVVVNFLNFTAFAAQSSPFVSVFNTAITVISYAQFALLLWPSNGIFSDNNRRVSVFLFADFPSKIFRMETKK